MGTVYRLVIRVTEKGRRRQVDPWKAQQASLAFSMSIQEKGDYLKQKNSRAAEKGPAGFGAHTHNHSTWWLRQEDWEAEVRLDYIASYLESVGAGV